MVRGAVGYGRLAGEQAYRQLRELYRALRLHVNCFQPSMKLQAIEAREGQERRVYDPAKTPLQRLLLAGILSEQKEQELREVAAALDPLSLMEQVEVLQGALLCSAVPASVSALPPSDPRSSAGHRGGTLAARDDPWRPPWGKLAEANVWSVAER